MVRSIHYLIVLMVCVTAALGQTYKVLWSFGGSPSDGANPVSDLVFDKSGNIYGTTEFGGPFNPECPDGCGTIFELSPNSNGTWAEIDIYSFCVNSTGCLDGQEPKAGLAMDSFGNLYGTTYLGGPCPITQCGTVFELSPPQQPGGSWTESVLYTFCSVYENNTCLDGSQPASHLTFDDAGNLYGTTTAGGNGAWFGGTVFELFQPSQQGGPWTEAVLYNFCTNGSNQHCPDGTNPLAGVTFDNEGNLYGTTQWGGSPSGGGGGTVYELSPGISGWTHELLFAFTLGIGQNLLNPRDVVSFDALGNLYGTAYQGGPSGLGGVFKLNRKTNIVRALSFDGTNGGFPTSGLVVNQKTGTIYGANTAGDQQTPGGVIFEIGKESKVTVLYTFCQQANCTDGSQPSATLSAQGSNLYGTTRIGGVSSSLGGNGVVFQIAP